MTVEKLIKEVLIIDEEVTLNDDTGPEDIEAWDSLGHVNIITAIEDEHDVEFTPEEIGEIRSVGDFKQVLAEKGVDPS